MYVPILQVRGGEVLIYDQWTGVRRFNHTKIEKPAYSGQTTHGNTKRLRKAVSLMVQKSPKKRIWNPVINKYHDFSVSFITLTIGDQGKDTAKDVYSKCLAPFLRWARGRGMKDYVWKAELQERGAVHYHILANTFIHYQSIQDYWNKKQKSAGYLRKFVKENKHYRPNSVDVHSVWKVDNVEAYMLKYMSKDNSGTINGKIWDCSRNLKEAKYFSTELTPSNLERIRAIAKKEVQLEHCAIFRMKQGYHKYVLDQHQLGLYRAHLLAI